MRIGHWFEIGLLLLFCGLIAWSQRPTPSSPPDPPTLEEYDRSLELMMVATFRHCAGGSRRINRPSTPTFH